MDIVLHHAMTTIQLTANIAETTALIANVQGEIHLLIGIETFPNLELTQGDRPRNRVTIPMEDSVPPHTASQDMSQGIAPPPPQRG